ncbi:MAG: DUF2799 domain-containing protein [Candidatus Azotimanducaceae bacterium WSBS_2022_MAG_OTU7]
MNIRIKSICLFAVVSIVLSGCSSLSEDECLNADWRSIGYEDGAAGQGGDHVGNHREACAKFGITPDFDIYQSGRLEGLDQYCVPINGFQVGRSGGSYQNVCDASTEEEFLYAYRQGMEVGDMEREISQLRFSINSDRHKLKKLDRKANAPNVEGQLADAAKSKEERRKLLDDIRKWEKESGAAETRIRQAEDQLIMMEVELRVMLSNSDYL